HIARWLGARTVDFDTRRRVHSSKRLGHLAAIGILDANEDDTHGHHFAPTSARRFSAISFSSTFCGSANFLIPSSMSTASIWAISTLAAISSSTSLGGSLSTCRVKVRPLLATASLVAGG